MTTNTKDQQLPLLTWLRESYFIRAINPESTGHKAPWATVVMSSLWKCYPSALNPSATCWEKAATLHSKKAQKTNSSSSLFPWFLYPITSLGRKLREVEEKEGESKIRLSLAAIGESIWGKCIQLPLNARGLLPPPVTKPPTEWMGPRH